MLAAEKISLAVEVDSSCGSAFVDGHAANGINRVSVSICVLVIHIVDRQKS